MKKYIIGFVFGVALSVLVLLEISGDIYFYACRNESIKNNYMYMDSIDSYLNFGEYEKAEASIENLKKIASNENSCSSIKNGDILIGGLSVMASVSGDLDEYRLRLKRDIEFFEKRISQR